MTDRSRVEIIEVGPRDGLQNEPRAISVDEKIAFVDALSGAGFARIEAGSFVSPRWVPQMAGTGDVFRGIARAPGTMIPDKAGYVINRSWRQKVQRSSPSSSSLTIFLNESRILVTETNQVRSCVVKKGDVTACSS